MCEIISPELSIVLFGLFFALTAAYIFARDVIFSVFYALLFMYTFFTELASLLYPSQVRLPGVPPGDDGDWCSYRIFVRLSFVVVVILFVLFNARRPVHLRPVVRARPSFALIFYVFAAAFDVALMVIFLANADALTYGQQDAFKENGLFRNMFAFANAMFILLIALLRTRMPKTNRWIVRALLIFLTVDILSVAARTGSRGSFLILPIGWLVYTLLSSPLNRQKLWFYAKVAAVVGVIGYMAVALQVQRRNPDNSLVNYLSALARPDILTQDYLFSPYGLLFQDYTGSSLLLLHSIRLDLVRTEESLWSVIQGGIPLSGTPSLGSLAARAVNPSLQYSWQGYGYYYLNEGFSVAGWWGILYNGFVLNLGYWVWRKLFVDVEDRNLRALMGALVAMQAIDIIRGQSSAFLRAPIFAFLPTMFLYYLATGVRARYLRKVRPVLAAPRPLPEAAGSS